MDRIITVTGTGNISVAPDTIELSFSVSDLKKAYNKAFDGANGKAVRLQEAVKAVGFEEDSLKTTNFRVDTRYESIRDDKGNYKQQFTGYACCYDMKLSFAFDTSLLAKVLGQISDCGAEPELNIRFTVKDTDAVRKELLENAAQNALEKANILCKASGVQLGELVAIDYNWADRALVSNTRFEVSNDAVPLMAKRASGPSITPDDIQVKDSAVFRWTIL